MRWFRLFKKSYNSFNRTSTLLNFNRDFHGGQRNHKEWWWSSFGYTAAASTFVIGYLADQQRNRRLHAATLADFAPNPRTDLPTYKIEEIRKHDKSADRVWVTFKEGVYDVTEFVGSHPGGDKILLAAGGSVEPFWSIYAQHKTAEVMRILEELRIGNVDPEDFKKFNQQKKDENDPFSSDPLRHPALLVNSAKPFNAETPPSLLLDSFRTPNDLFFIRNHMPVPNTKEKDHFVHIEGEGIKNSIRLSVEQLKMEYEPCSVVSVIQCAGNRRNDMNNYKKVNGLMWTGTAISNAKWTGARLRDILLTAGVNPNDPNIKHVQFEGADHDITGTRYGASIPFRKAMSPECIVAYKMNDVDIPADHGYPLRLVVPGNVGARQVKWLTGIKTSREESTSHWQKKDYRAFAPNVESGNEIDYDSVPAIQEYPVQSAICTPAPETKVSKDEPISMAGYAWSGGGRGIIRVEVSADGGKTWFSAKLIQDPDQDLDNMWAWTFWNVEIPVPKGVKVGQKVELICKATDRAYNTQPETAVGLWNIRGLLHNAWHRINITIVE
ncbi:Sulfite oxidase, mitochondrial [Aphelenchoides besseyi]|nr:Sulfite oxidase, mitochondrial [Aphelenchoides besseyi]KAI6210628.1 Sulfite oxidase, mitochondrial [Aphelenchoides besseyi]